MSDEKTEEPTEHKLQDARKKGQTAKSQDVNAAASMIVATLCLVGSGSLAGDRLNRLFDQIYARAWSQDTTISVVLDMTMDAVKEMLLMCVPYLGAAVLVGFVASFAQVGLMITFEPLLPNFDKLNPASGIKKLFSLRSLIDFFKMVVKAVALGAVIWVLVVGLLPLLIGTSLQRPQLIVQVAWAAILKLMGAATIVFIVVGPVDFGIQKWLFKRDQKMSKDEVKREHKESEGDPELKGKRKELANEIANSAPKNKVPGSSVVVTNPTHYAVALLYKPGKTPLPLVVCKGQDAEAALIREIATEHKVPIVSNPPLARALYKLKVDEHIPEPLFEAVAAVLRWVAMLDQFSNGLGATPTMRSKKDGG